MNVLGRGALVALSSILLLVASCDGNDPTQPDSAPLVETQSLEDAIEGTPYTAQLEGSGGSGEYTWAVTDGSLPIGLSLTTNGAIGGTPSTPGSVDFEVRVTDSAGRNGTAELSISVIPRLAVGTTALAFGVTGEAYSDQLEAVGGRADYTWALSSGAGPSWLAVSPGGVLSGTPPAAGVATVTVTVTDASGQEATGTLPLTVLDPLVISTTSLPTGTQGRPFGAQLEAAGGDGEYTWSLAEGVLPGGLEVTASGTVVGIPVESGTSGFTVRVTDGGTRSAIRPLTLTVAPAPTIQTTGLPAAAPDMDYSVQLQATGGTGAYSWSITNGSLPTGLTMSDSGLISGTPTTIGTSSFTVRVIDESGDTHTRPLSITVANAAVLGNGSPVPGLSGEAESVRYFLFEVPAGATQLLFTMEGGTGDADLYVRFGALPQLFSYDCRPLREGNDEICTFTSPSAGPWYIMIRGYSDFAGVTFTATHDG